MSSVVSEITFEINGEETARFFSLSEALDFCRNERFWPDNDMASVFVLVKYNGKKADDARFLNSLCHEFLKVCFVDFPFESVKSDKDFTLYLKFPEKEMFRLPSPFYEWRNDSFLMASPSSYKDCMCIDLTCPLDRKNNADFLRKTFMNIAMKRIHLLYGGIVVFLDQEEHEELFCHIDSVTNALEESLLQMRGKSRSRLQFDIIPALAEV